jgi:exodeoxyribonuclease VII large subunit
MEPAACCPAILAARMTANFFEFQQSLRRARTPTPPASGAGEAALTVSQITAKIARALSGALPASVQVRGEVSNVKFQRASGHFYFTLKDADACLDCVMFRSEAERLKFNLTDGLELVAGGRIGVYAQRGRYQLYVSSLRPLGQGALELAFAQMRAKLEGEGLFSAGRKKPLPLYPLRIVLITSAEAAALHDILKVLGRFPWLKVMLYPVPVQGDGAGQKIAAAIKHVNFAINSIGGFDVIVLTRGGGSLEDLWGFNEECVARAVAASLIPVVTGIGHEVDMSIADLVADHHAHTPTEAAQIITAQWRNVQDHLDTDVLRLRRGARVLVSEASQALRAIERHEAFRRPMDRVNQLRQLIDDRQRALSLGAERLVRGLRDKIQLAEPRLERFFPALIIRSRELLAAKQQQLDHRLAHRLRASRDRIARAALLLQDYHPRLGVRLAAQQLNAAQNRLQRSTAQNFQARARQLDSLARQLEAISAQSVLRRGFTITTRKNGGLALRSAGEIKPGDRLLTRFADGQIESTALDSRQLSLFE